MGGRGVDLCELEAIQISKGRPCPQNENNHEEFIDKLCCDALRK